jgi:hypothetical protein
MEIKFEIKYSFNTAKQTYQAQIILYLPKEPSSGSAIHHLLRSNKATVFSESLISNWGWNDEKDKNLRHSLIERECGTIQELKEIRDKVITEAVDTLKSVYQNNQNAILEIPSDYVYVFNL